MTVLCKFYRCGFYQNGFCNNPTVSINENGMCAHLYKISNGAVVQPPGALDAVGEEFKQRVVITEAKEVEEIDYGYME